MPILSVYVAGEPDLGWILILVHVCSEFHCVLNSVVLRLSDILLLVSCISRTDEAVRGTERKRRRYMHACIH
jgi:hypothetical protein